MKAEPAVEGDVFYETTDWAKCIDNCGRHGQCTLGSDFANSADANLELKKGDDGSLIVSSNNCVGFPSTYCGAIFDADRPCLNADSVEYFAASAPSGAISFASHFTAAQVAPQGPASRLVGIDNLIEGPVTGSFVTLE